MVYINNASNFKDSMDIVLEVMEGTEQEAFQSISNELTHSLSNLSQNGFAINLSQTEKQELYNCLQSFKETKTYYYLREDLKNSLIDLEIQCRG
ncbi:hypothetical protein [Ferdinandcohnia sp. SAFN-114]|uniref:hypothetical protein n=1 Tax=Ferdinandcohnia sp. SAFN-114 TaxID=3387275 RepID=UPI003F7CF078